MMLSSPIIIPPVCIPSWSSRFAGAAYGPNPFRCRIFLKRPALRWLRCCVRESLLRENLAGLNLTSSHRRSDSAHLVAQADIEHGLRRILKQIDHLAGRTAQEEVRAV